MYRRRDKYVVAYYVVMNTVTELLKAASCQSPSQGDGTLCSTDKYFHFGTAVGPGYVRG